MKRTIPMVLVLVLVLGVGLAPDAEAGWKNKDKDKDKKLLPRYDNHPTMSFIKGELGRGIGQSWELDEYTLQFMPDCKITSELGDDGELSAGREAIVVGSRLGDTIIVHRVRIIKPDYLNEGAVKSSQVIPSEVDPTVGVGTGPE